MIVLTKRIAVLLVAGVFCAHAAHAQDKKTAEKAPTATAKSVAADKKPTPQQERMGTCNRDAKDKKLAGDARKEFMKDCLGGKPAAAADKRKVATRQGKMGKCNAEAREKKIAGADRKAFMSNCLKS
jgi:hypothetical protein